MTKEVIIMLKPREELEKKLIGLFFNIPKADKQRYYLELESKYNIPIDMSTDIFNSIKDLSGYNQFVLFTITQCIKPSYIPIYFTDREIKDYTNKKMTNTKIKFPIKFKMFEVAPDQWIGVSNVQFLMKLREAQLINYNADTQRALEIMLSNGNEILRPSVEYKAVNEIAQAYEDNSFIPNTISLNISQDDELADFDYDNETNILTIRTIGAFDIFDGYHRYLGMSRNYDKDRNFDYPTELRITNFSVSKAKQFIFQEDHKTKMKKIAANTYDQRNPGNITLEKLNTDSSFNLYNQINLTGGYINAGDMSIIINKAWFNSKTNVERKDIISTTKNIKQKINEFTEEYDEYLGRKWSRYETYIILYKLHEEENYEDIINSIKNISSDNKKKLNQSMLSTPKEYNILKEV